MENNTILFHFLFSNSLRRFANKNSCVEKNTITAKSINKRWLLMPLMVLTFLFSNGNAWGQVTYTLGNTGYYTIFTDGTAGAFANSGTAELGMYANTSGNKQVVAWRNFKTAGDNTGSNRNLQVGDVFTIQVYATAAYGTIGFSLNASPSTGSWANRISNSRLYIQADGTTGSWYVNSSAGNTSLNYNVSTTGRDYQFKVYITSQTTCDVELYVGGTLQTSLYNLTMNGTAGANISHFVLYLNDDYNGSASSNIYWKQTTTHNATGIAKLGYNLASDTYTPGLVADGLTNTSTSSANNNAVNIGGSSGSSVVLSQANTYTGLTTVNANATLKLGVSSTASSSGPLGNTTGATSITSGGVLDMNGFSLTSSATEGLTINGTGISSGGALINSSGTGTTWAGTVALGSDASVGGSGNTTLSGVVSGAYNLTKVGAGTVTLSNTNTFGGASKSLTVAQGTLSVNSLTNALGDASNTLTLGASSTSGTLSSTSAGSGNISRSFTVAAGGGTLQIAGSGTPTFLSTSGTYTGTLNGEFTVSCSSTGGVQFNLGLSGAGGMTVNSSGSGVVTMGTSGAVAATYSGDTKITAGTLQLGVANMLPNSSKLLLNGGTFSTGASTGYAETVGTLQLTDNSTIALGTGSHNINFTTSNSIAWTASKILTITGWTGTAAGGTAGRIYVGSTSSGLTQAQLDAITFSGAANTGAQILSTGEIVPNYSATITSTTSGNWNSTSTWVGGVVPTSVDNVVIASTHTVTVTADATCKKVTFTGAGGVVSVNTAVTLTVTSSIDVDQSASQNNAATVSGLGTLTCTSVNVGSSNPTMTALRTTTLTSTISNFTSSGGLTLTSRDVTFKNNPLFYLQSGTFTCTDITTVHPVGSNVATISLSTGAQTGTLKLSGSTPFTLDADGTNTITLTGTGATVEYSGTAQTVYNTSYTNLTLSGSGNKTMAAFSISGKLSIQGTAVAITTAPTFGASSTLEYKNVGTRTTNAIEWPSASGPSNLIIDNSGSTVTMLASANRTLTGNLTLTAGTLADAGNTLTLQGNIAGTATHSGAGVISMTGASKTISGATLGNVTLNNVSGFSLSGSPTINGALTFTSGKLSLGANTLNLAGTVASMTSSNNITGSTSSNVSITGTGTLGTLLFDQTTAGTTNALNNLTINRTSTGIINLGSALNLAGNLTVTNGSLRSSGANTLTMSGTSQSITISNTSGGSILGTDNSAGNDLTLTIANGSTTTLTGDATSTNDDDKKFFNVTVNSGGTLALSRGILCKYGTFTVNGTLQINSNGYLQATPTAGSAIAPTYGASSLLKYNTASIASAAYGRGLEWSATSGAGYPNNVQLSNNTFFDLGNNGTATARQIAGSLTIDAGSGFLMDFSSNTMSQPLTVLGSVTNNGSLSLSSTSGGGLKVGGDFANNGTFNPYTRTVEFLGSTAQIISGSLNGINTTNNFAYLTISNTSGGVSLSTPVVVTNTLNLNTGIVTTTSTNILHITNTAAAAMVNGSSASYVSGPLRWSVSNSGGGDYKFHVGKSSTYLPLNVNNPTGTSPVITAEAFAANAGGAAGSGLSSISTSEYWSVVNTGTLTASTISLAKASIGSNDGIGSSTTLAGTYTNLGGSTTSTLITSNTVTAVTTVGSLATTTYFVLGVKVAAPTISSFTPSSGYVSTTITITGTNFTNASAVTIGGVAAASYTVNSATSISATVAAGVTTGTIAVTTPGGTATSASNFTFGGYISAAATDWNTASTWLGGAVPPAGATVTIDHYVTVNSTVTAAPATVIVNASKTLTFGASGELTATTVTNNGSVVMTAGGTLTVAASGTLTNNATYTRGTGTVNFAGAGTVNGSAAITFNNLTINTGTVTLTTVPTIDGTIRINGGNVSAAPVYSANSTLLYNATYNRFNEWNASGVGTIGTTAGYPNNVTINSGTFTVINGDAGTARAINGSLTVASGATFTTGALNALVTLGGDITNNGTIDLSTTTSRIKCTNFTNNSGATTTLSSSVGGDLEVTGSVLDNGTFNANTRAIFFTGSSVQDISGSGLFNIDYVVSNKSAGRIRLLSNLLCEGPNGGNAITLTNSTDILDLNGYTFTLGKASVASTITGSGFVRGSSTSSLSILGTGALGTIKFDQTTAGTTNVLQNLTINRTSTGAVTLGSALTVGGTLTLTDGTMTVGANTLTYSGSSISRTSGAIDASNGNATVAFTNTSALTLPASLFSGNVNNLTMNGAGGVTLGSATTVAGTLTLTTGDIITSSTNTLTLTSAATLSGGSASSYIEGPLDRTVANGSSFTYPVGTATNYRPLALQSVNATTGAVVRVTMDDTGATTGDGSTISATLSSARNWRVQTISGTFNSATVNITETGLTDGVSLIASSSAQSGTYVSAGSPQNVASGAITSPSGQAAGYFAIAIGCVNPTSAGTIAGNQTICSGGDPAEITSSAAASGQNGTLEYKWQSSTTSASSGFSDITGATSESYDPLAGLTTTTYYKRLAKVTCKSSWTGALESGVVTVTVNALPSVSITGSSSICIGATTALSPSTGGTWSSSDNNVATVTNVGLVTGVAAGTATFTFTNSSTNCSATTSAVTVKANPTALTLTGVAGCGSGSITSSTSQNGVSYQLFNGSNNEFQSAKSGTGSGLTWLGVTFGSGYYTIATLNGCTATSNSVSVNPSVTAVTLTGSTICTSPGNDGTISTNTSASSESNTNYQLYNSLGNFVQSSKSGNGSPLTWTGLSAGTGYYVIATQGLCGAQSDPVDINSVSTTALSLTGSNVCQNPGGNTGTITSTTSVIGVNYQLYNASNATVQTAQAGTGSALTWSGLPVGNGYYVIASRATSPACPSTSAGVNITSVTNPDAPSASAQSFCFNASPTVANLTATGSSIQWYSTSTGGSPLSGSTSLSSVNYFASQTVTGCESTTRTSVSVTVNSVISGNTSGAATSICSNSTATLTGGTASGGSGSYTYLWESSANGSTGWGNAAGTNTEADYTTATLTTSTYFRRTTYSGGCTDVATGVLVTVTAPPNAGTLSGTQGICSTGSTSFTSNGDSGSWSSGSTGVATINSSTGAITPVAAGTSTITYTVTGTGGCSDATATRTVTVTTAPSAGTLSGSQTICSSSSTTFASSVSGGTWSSSNTGVATIGSSTGVLTPVAAGIATLTYTIEGTGGCSNAIATRTLTVTQSDTVTWNGSSWSPTAPTASNTVVIAGNLQTSQNITACSLRVTNSATVDILSGVVTLDGPLIAESNITFNNNAILLQNGSGYLNTGNINFKRSSSPIFRLDYTLWSSPLTAASQPIFDFSPQTLTNRFYTYNESNNLYTTNDMYTINNPPLSATSSFQKGRGYLIRSPNNWVTSAAAVWTGTFTGVPNTGDISVAINRSTGNAYGYNAVGNPYPSPISIASFLSDNSSVIGSTLWFWRKINGVSGSAYITYSAGTYSSGAQSVYNIQPGQGFFVRATSSGSLQFKNSQRVGTNGSFFRVNSQTTAAGEGRLWLNLKSNSIVVGNMALGYKEGATNDLDIEYDGEYLNDNPLALTSSLPGKELSVQHRAAPFVDTDVVPLSFKTDVAGTYSIDFNGTDGVLDTQDIYLEDLLLGQSVAIKTTPYTFASEAGTFSDRFRIVYINSALGTDEPVFNTNQVVIYKNEINDFVINSGNVIMSNIKVFDVRGRLLQEYKNVNDSETTINVGIVNQVLLVQITSEDGVTVTKKVIR